MSEEEEALPRLLSGRYRLEAKLGSGGMGVVYRGIDLLMKRPVAVKLISAVDGQSLDDEVAGRFLREAKNTARLQNEHIVEVFDLGRSDDGLYFVMELLEGESLSARLRREGKLSPQATVHIARQICDALTVAHTIGVVHRDLKPANVMLLSRAGDDEYVKVLDFGVAKSYAGDMETQLTQTGMLVGTVDYMAPEQIMGKAVDGRTDVYSLGIVLYKMLSGKLPFKDNGVPSLIHAHLNTMPKPLIEVVPDIPNELGHVVLRCLMKAQDRRYESMAELGRALTAALMPDNDGLINLEYGRANEHDPYTADDHTQIGRLGGLDAPQAGTPTATAAPMLVSVPVPSPSQSSPLLAFDEATIRIDRKVPKKPNTGRGAGGGLPMTPRNVGVRPPAPPPPPPARPSTPPTTGRRRSLPPELLDSSDQATLLHNAEDFAPKKRDEPKSCPSCHAMNSPRANVCASCGSSLSGIDLEVLKNRQRNMTGPPPPASHPQMAHGYDPRMQSGPYPGAGAPHSPNGTWIPIAQQAPSMWQRFLTWTGIRNR